MARLASLYFAVSFAFSCICAAAAADVAVALRGGEQQQNSGVAIVEPVPGSTRLAVSQRGLQVLRGIQGPVAPIVVIGPYRSGKSFFINQMLNQSCSEGMTVGHTRSTQTKGVWLWGAPVMLPQTAGVASNAPPLSLLFFDTEGFESTGKSGAYDDRIFALAAVLSSTLVYNLAEAIRESDIQKLSFAVDLARAFYSSDGHSSAYVEPSSMLWLIQRDFLKGASAEVMLHESLAPVPNPQHQEDITNVNRIRESLSLLARDSVGVGLPQPHLDRTRLCEMTDADLAPEYVSGRDHVRDMLLSSARPKMVKGEPLTGSGLAQLVEDMVAALNSRDIPTSASLLDTFNEGLVAKCSASHAALLAAVHLPTSLDELQRVHTAAKAAALERFHRDSFGVVSASLLDRLTDMLAATYASTLSQNEAQSSRRCDALELQCESQVERLSGMALPSLGRFDAKSSQCAQWFRDGCVGPARERQEARLVHATERERARFQRDYNNRLYMGLVILSLLAAVTGRFVVKRIALEAPGWLLFAFLQIYPRMTLGAEHMYKSAWWLRLVAVWEMLIFNPFIDLGTWWLPLALCGGAVGYRVWILRQRNKLKLLPVTKQTDRDLRV